MTSQSFSLIPKSPQGTTVVCDRCCCYAVTKRVRATCSAPTVTVSIKDANGDSCAVTCRPLCFIFCQYLQKCHISVIVLRHVFSVNWMLPGELTFSICRKQCVFEIMCAVFMFSFLFFFWLSVVENSAYVTLCCSPHTRISTNFHR